MKQTAKERVLQTIYDHCESEAMSVEKLQEFFERYPWARKHRHDNRSWLVKCCFNACVSLPIVQYLVSIDPEAVHDTETCFLLPIFPACVYAGVDVVRFLVELHPDALLVRCHTNKLPIHWYLRRTDHLDVDFLNLLVERAPSSLMEPTPDDKLPIHYLCGNKGVTLETLELILSATVSPDSLQVEAGGFPRGTPLEHLLHNKNAIVTLEMVEFLVQHDTTIASRQTQDSDGMILFPIHSACRNLSHNIAPIIHFLGNQFPTAITTQAAVGTPLHVLCLNKNASVEAVAYLVEQHPQAVDTMNFYGLFPLDYAVVHCHESVVRYLFERTAIPEGKYPLHRAAASNSLECVEYLFSQLESSISLADEGGNLPLHAACRSGSVQTLEFLHAKFPSAIRTTNKAGELPLHVSCCNNSARSADAIRYLADLYPEALYAKDSNGYLPFHSICAGESYSKLCKLEALFELNPSAVSTPDNKGNFPLHIAAGNNDCSWNNEDLMFVLRSYTAAANQPDENGAYPLHLALNHQDEVSLELYGELVQAFPDALDEVHKDLGSCLRCSVEQRNCEVVLDLLFRGSSHLPFHSMFRDSKLCHGPRDGSLAIANWVLTKYPGNIHDEDGQGRTPLHLAVTQPHLTEVVHSLISMNAEAVRRTDKHRRLPIHYVFINEDPSNVAATLLGEYPEGSLISDANRMKPIHHACRHGAPVETVAVMVDANPQLCHSKDSLGEVPLHKACRGGHVELIELLVDRNPEVVRIPNKKGILPFLLLAQRSGKSRQQPPEDSRLLQGMCWKLLTLHPEAILLPADRSIKGHSILFK